MIRAILTTSAIHCWQELLPHAEFERRTGIAGIRLRLLPETVLVNDETVAMPEHFAWVYGREVGELDIDDRRMMVEGWLKASPLLIERYPAGFQVSWYS